ncbi:MAG: ABC transporter ATP-binding protein [Tenericutes bacterium]|jgi:ABC-type multidrug transport system fused ATPase/permease subunit|nr:ABC transporter ATP-binding protein [Mycoplasmatota bacterium]
MKTKYSTWEVFKFHIKGIKESKKNFIFIIFIIYALSTGILNIVTVLFPRYIIDAIVVQNIDNLFLWIFIYGISILVLMLLSTITRNIFSGNAMAIKFAQFGVFFKKYRHVSYRYLEGPTFQAKRSTALWALGNNDIGYEGTLRSLFRLFPQILTVIGLTILLGLFRPIIVIVALVLSLLQYQFDLRGKKYKFKHRDELNERERKAGYFFRTGHDFSFGKDIRINQIQKQFLLNHKEKSNIFTSLFKKLNVMGFRFTIPGMFFITITNGLTYFLVANAYMNGGVSIGQVSSIIWATLAITLGLQRMFTEIAKIKEDTSYTSEYMAFLENDDFFPKQGGIEIDLETINIELVNVSFKYPNSDKYALKNINLKLNSGERLALVGINGSGKTTLVKLLCGFYEPTEGNILINGVDIKNIDLEYYRNRLAVIFQEVLVYAASILENIVGLSQDPKEHEKAMSALKLAGLYEKTKSFPKEEHQELLKVIDPSGTDFSGGEKQKLSIARALYKENTSLIILDEPTASLDAIAEKEIYDNFKTLINKRTALIISHRLASTKFCDNIVLFEDGEILEYGTHESLMKNENGTYQSMFLTQGKYYQEGAAQHETI